MFGFFALTRAGARNLDTPPEGIVVFDGHDGAADRRALLPHYKPPVTDDEVFADLPRIHDGLDLLGIHWIQDNQGEADDVIASLIAAQPATLLADRAHREDLDKLDRLTGGTGALIRHQCNDLGKYGVRGHALHVGSGTNWGRHTTTSSRARVPGDRSGAGEVKIMRLILLDDHRLRG